MKDFHLIQHNLIPIALFAGNIAVVHFIYLLAESRYDYLMAGVFICLGILGGGIVRQQKYLIIIGAVSYVLLLVLTL